MAIYRCPEKFFSLAAVPGIRTFAVGRAVSALESGARTARPTTAGQNLSVYRI